MSSGDREKVCERYSLVMTVIVNKFRRKYAIRDLSSFIRTRFYVMLNSIDEHKLTMNIISELSPPLATDVTNRPSIVFSFSQTSAFFERVCELIENNMV